MITFMLAVCGNVDYIYTFPPSPPSRAAWIEISSFRTLGIRAASPPSRAAWIEILPKSRKATRIRSPPSRAAWIEIVSEGMKRTAATRRRLHGRRGLKWFFVAKWLGNLLSPPSRAAWIEICCLGVSVPAVGSPPSRAAWIEIMLIRLIRCVLSSRRLHGRRGLK